MWIKGQRSKDNFQRLKTKVRRPKVEKGAGRKNQNKNEGFPGPGGDFVAPGKKQDICVYRMFLMIQAKLFIEGFNIFPG
jgi:hypothetical protein